MGIVLADPVGGIVPGDSLASKTRNERRTGRLLDSAALLWSVGIDGFLFVRCQGIAMKLTSLVFFLLLLLAHAMGDPGELLGQPLSLFRDGEQGGPLGYALFAVLLLNGLLYTVTLVRFDRIGEAGMAGLAVGFLAVVAATPSWDAFHLVCSLLLLLLLFSYYATLLYRAGSPWLIVHLAVPFALVSATRLHSYGLWQKSLIAYFVLLAVVHHHILLRGRTDPRRSLSGRRLRGNGVYQKRRKVYQVEASREWARERTVSESSSPHRRSRG
jgi:hypothetical protein